jgi:sugar phosphate isomerase/epimerase
MSVARVNRRELLGAGLAVAAMPAAAGAAPSAPAPPAGPWHGLRIGVASYTFRSFGLDALIAGTKRVGLDCVSLKEMHLPLKSAPEQRKAVASRLRDAGVEPLSCGVIYLPNDEPGIRNAFEYTRDLGSPVMVCSFDPAIVGVLDRYVAEFDLRLAIHNHGPGDKRFSTPDVVWETIQNHDKRIGFCIDVGHTLRAGVDPAKAILKHRERLYDVHLKDVDRAEAKGGTLEAGRGVLDLKAVLAALVKIGFRGMADFEYEKDGADPLPGLAESVGYCKGLMAGVK